MRQRRVAGAASPAAGFFARQIIDQKGRPSSDVRLIGPLPYARRFWPDSGASLQLVPAFDDEVVPLLPRSGKAELRHA